MVKAVQLAGQDADDWFAAGQTYQTLALFDDALQCYKTALTFAPNHTDSLLNLAKLHLQRQEVEPARKIALQMSSKPDLTAMANYILGKIALSEGKTAQALTMLKNAAELNPHSLDLWLALADAYQVSNNALGLQQALQQAVPLKPNNFPLQKQLADVCFNNGDWQCAGTAYEHAVQMHKADFDVRMGLAKSLLKQNKPILATEQVKQAIAIDATKVQAVALLADIQIAHGHIVEGIDTLKRAIKLDNNSEAMHLKLAKAYLSNHLYDLAQESAQYASTLADKSAAPQALLGEIFLARQMFTEAIAALNKAKELDPSHTAYAQRLNYVYLQKKNVESGKGQGLSLSLTKLSFEKVFSAAYKQYAHSPVGTVTVRNDSGVAYENVKLSFQIKNYMDFETTHSIAEIKPHESVEVPLLASFNNNILSIDENTGVQSEVKISYYAMGKPQEKTLTQPLTIYGKNAMLWSNMPMIGSFVTPKDEILSVFTRQGLNKYRRPAGQLNKTLVKAMTMFELMSKLDIKYIEDPNNPYSKLDTMQVDTVQFPRETLRVHSGDCDDLTILLTSALENLGIQTALLDVPGHLFFMFNTGLPERLADRISSNPNRVAIYNDEVWIPIEATLIATSFSEAWVVGAEKYTQAQAKHVLNVVPLKQAWQSYTPVTLPPANFEVPVPTGAQVDAAMTQAWNRLAEDAAARAIIPFQEMLAMNPQDNRATMQMAIVYARYGLFARAKSILNDLLAKDASQSAVHTNMGNVYYLEGDMQKALASYQVAEKLEPKNANIKVNIAMTYYKLGDSVQSGVKFTQAQAIDSSVNITYKALKALLNK